VTEIVLPTLHEDQVRAFDVYQENQFTAIRAGRRWGKTDFGKTIACDAAIKRKSVGWFAPDYRIQSEAFREIADILEPVKSSSSQTAGVYRTRTGGRIDYWTLDNERAGRSRKYHIVIIDEAAFTKPNMMAIWQQSIQPTLLDYNGKAIVLSNTNGNDTENFLWRICNQPEHKFKDFHAPTMANPLLPLRMPTETEEEWQTRRALVLQALKDDNHPLVYQQEYLAEFVDWSGVAFFSLDKMLENGLPVAYPTHCDGVFAIIDTAVKTGKDNDGTAVLYCARSKFFGHPLTILDWDIVQIEGALLETWLPTVFENLERLARETGARMGSLGAWIEDKSSGSILLQQAKRRNWNAHEIESTLTAVGKDERAISVSGYVYRGEVKVSKAAFDKVTTYKGVSRNHFIAQVLGFRIGDKQAAKRADDLLDTFTYAIAIALGNAEGQ